MYSKLQMRNTWTEGTNTAWITSWNYVHGEWTSWYIQSLVSDIYFVSS